MQKQSLTEFMKTQPDGTLENIAKEYQVSLFEVINAMPEKKILTADHFDAVWEAILKWGKITFIVHTKDIIFEYAGELPAGSHQHGYFNLKNTNGVSGHIKATECAHIAFVKRSFMNVPTASVLFLNHEGNVMFKVFISRDENKQLNSVQLKAFDELSNLK